MIGMWFTFGLDSECLIQSINSFRALFPGGVVCISDDKITPLPKHALSDIAPDHHEFRDWDSCGNLNGWTSVFGILDFQARMHLEFPLHEGALKIDSDTLIFGRSWFFESDALAGFDYGSSGQVSGACRWLRCDVPCRLLDFVRSKYTNRSLMVGEDAAITTHALWLFGHQCRRNDWDQRVASWTYRQPNPKVDKAEVVTFGNRFEIEDVDARSVVAKAMRDLTSERIR